MLNCNITSLNGKINFLLEASEFKLKEGNSVLDTQSTECHLQGQAPPKGKCRPRSACGAGQGPRSQDRARGATPAPGALGERAWSTQGTLKSAKATAGVSSSAVGKELPSPKGDISCSCRE